MILDLILSKKIQDELNSLRKREESALKRHAELTEPSRRNGVNKKDTAKESKKKEANNEFR